MICAGIDAGSRTIKVVALDADRMEVIASATTDQGVQQGTLAQTLLEESLRGKGLCRGEVSRIVATGYGRHSVGVADETITEITCHARGVHRLVPEAKTVIEIGGQDSKLLWLNGDGSVRDFAMNDRCAAGTGRFLEMVAKQLDVGLDELGEIACASHSPAAISSMCIVFAETEIIGLLAGGTEPEDIVAGVQQAIARRVHAMAGRRVVAPVAFTGGVAMIPGMAKPLGAAIGMDVIVAPAPQMTGALGAALLAAG